MVKTQNNENSESNDDSELDGLKKLGVMFDTLEKKAWELREKDKTSKIDTIIEKADSQKQKEKILETQETTESVENIASELVGTLYLPIELFLNDGLEAKGIDIINENEIQKLLDLLFKLLPKEAFETITEAFKKTKKISWLKNMDKGIAVFKHIFKMFYKRYKQYKTWLELHPKKEKVD
ncbi:hypothetical protein LCGC14_1264760 [marine sediment metagenome]|uniref:Uncharacterized protein n=1 Tax=marine sediment metagenome TaxID=412755 RepID=A0A0F9P334_9ZZZZ